MKYLIFVIVPLLLISCTNNKMVYWCGDHACINNKEKKAYFKKTMIVEMRELNKVSIKSKTDLEIIKQQARLEEKRRIKEEKNLAKQVRLEEERGIKEEKVLAKQMKLEEKRRIKEEKDLAKQVKLEEKKRIKAEKKLSKKKFEKTHKTPSKNKIVVSASGATINIAEFKTLIEKITKKNMFRPYPNINDIPN